MTRNILQNNEEAQCTACNQPYTKHTRRDAQNHDTKGKTASLFWNRQTEYILGCEGRDFLLINLLDVFLINQRLFLFYKLFLICTSKNPKHPDFHSLLQETFEEGANFGCFGILTSNTVSLNCCTLILSPSAHWFNNNKTCRWRNRRSTELLDQFHQNLTTDSFWPLVVPVHFSLKMLQHWKTTIKKFPSPRQTQREGLMGGKTAKTLRKNKTKYNKAASFYDR